MAECTVTQTIQRKRVFQITELAAWLRCSLPTCRRRLKQWKAHTSYNHNGRYYTLPVIPVFDAQGIWHYRDISFSRYGNLKQTVSRLVHESKLGLSAAEIGDLLRMNPQSFLSHFQYDPGLYREKMGGRFIWFSAETKNRENQKQGRIQLECQKSISMPSDREAVLILLDLLHHPETSVMEMARRMQRKELDLCPEVIQGFLAHHDLLKKTTESNFSFV